MKEYKPRLYFLLLALACTSVLVFLIFRPFFYVLALAMIFASVFQPVYKKIVSITKEKRDLSAFLTILIVVTFIFTPLVFLGIQIFQETQQLYLSIADNGGKNLILQLFDGSAENLQKYLPASQDLSLTVDQYVQQGLSWLLQHLGSVFSSVAKMALGSFLFFFALYYLLKDGHKLMEKIIALSPLADSDDKEIFHKLSIAIESVMKGNLLIALIQGVMTSIGFAIFGVQNAVLWGSVAAIAALVPSVGTSLVLAPAVVFLFLRGDMFSATGLLIWGAVAVGLIDNILGPKLVSRGMQLHPLVVLLSVLGGLAFFGPVGFLLGPLSVSLLFALLDIYSSFAKKEKLNR